MADDPDAPQPDFSLISVEDEDEGIASGRKAVLTVLVLFVLVASLVAVIVVAPGEEEPAEVALQPGERQDRSIIAIRAQGDVVALAVDSLVARPIWSPPGDAPGSKANTTVSASVDDDAVYFTVTTDEPGSEPTIWRQADDDARAVAAGTLPAAGPEGVLAYVDPSGSLAIRHADGSTSNLPSESPIMGPTLRWSAGGDALIFNRSGESGGVELVVTSDALAGSPAPVVVLSTSQDTGVVADFLDDDRLVVAGRDASTEVSIVPIEASHAFTDSTAVDQQPPRAVFRIDPEQADRITDLAVDPISSRVLLVTERDGDGGLPASTLWVWSEDDGPRVVGSGYVAATWGAVGDREPETSATTTVMPPSDTSVVADCSASAFRDDRLDAQEGLPDAVQETRLGLFEAATTCDWERLLELRMPDPGWYLDAGYDIGAPQYELNLRSNRSQLDKLREEEAAGRRPLARLVEALHGSYLCRDKFCVWLAGPTTPGPERDDAAYYETRPLEVGVGTHGSWNLFWPLSQGTLPSNIFDCVADWAALERYFDCGYVGPPPQENGQWPADWPKIYWGGSWEDPPSPTGTASR